MKTLVSALLFFLSVPLFAPNETGSGGDPLAIEFYLRGKFVQNSLHQSSDLLTVEQWKNIEIAILRTPLEVVDFELIDKEGKVVAALTLDGPTLPFLKKIRLNRARWGEAVQLKQEGVKFAFHEYLNVIVVDDTNYIISSQIPLGELDFEKGGKVPTDILITDEKLDGDAVALLPGQTPGEVLRLAEVSQERACAQWRGLSARMMGPRMIEASCSDPLLSKIRDPWNLVSKEPLGFLSLFSGRATFVVHCPVKKTPITLYGKFFPAKKGDPPAQYRLALANARNSLESECHRWRNHMYESLGGSLIYASCGPARLAKHAYDRGFSYYALAEIYMCQPLGSVK